MTRERAKEKELILLLRRHNEQNYPKLKTCSIVIPEEIIDILCQPQKRTNEQNVTVEAFRKEAYHQLCTISKAILTKQQEKAKQTRENRLSNDPRYVKHFGIWIDKTHPSARLTRENYAFIDSVSTLYSYEYARFLIEHKKGENIFVDDEKQKVFYTEKFCKEHRERCLRNFDFNMQKFARIDHSEFEKRLLSFAKGRKFQQVFSFDDLLCTSKPYEIENVCGFVYIMVLDAYSQAYIGITESSVKNRIRQHWKKTKSFDRLIFGNENSSVLSIDSFGPLDTTRLFVKPYTEDLKTPLEIYENICIRTFGKEFLLNRL
ncbi:MAG: hypothetical protein IKJ51_05395 [Clostridia bacterium]|nr:hypothetical protein [Clostridia bacterium]